MTRIFAIAAAGFVLAAPAHAEWSLSNDASRLSFVTTKAGQVAEVHRFHTLTGSIDASGNVSVAIDLASVDTLIPVRDERMRDILFEVAEFPEATLTGTVDTAAVASLGVGTTSTMAVEGTLSLRGQSVPVTVEFLVAKLSSSRIVASSLQPVIINAGQVDLATGVEALREVAGLPSISPAVPVSLVLTFDADS